MKTIIIITAASFICLLAIFAPIRFIGREDNAEVRQFSIYSTDGIIDTTKYTEEDIEMAFY